VRFMAHNAAFNLGETEGKRSSEEQRARWLNVEQRVDDFVRSIESKRYLGETFPVFEPNLGPDVYAAFYGAELAFGEVTSWSHPIIRDWEDMRRLKLDVDGVYFRTIEALMRCAIERCEGKFLVGYTDLHPSVDCAMAWRGPEQLCMDLYDAPEQARQLIEIAVADFHTIFDRFHALLEAAGLPSVCWMGVPVWGKFHVPSCDFSAMISTEHFVEFSLPAMRREVQPMTRNIYHVDGRGVARHLDVILAEPEIHAIQRSEEHTSELQSRENLVCRLLL